MFLPDRFAARTPFTEQARVRVDGEIAEVPVNGAWMPTGDGRRWFIVAPTVFKAAGVRLGDVVEMRFRIDDPHRVDVPERLEAALLRDPDARQAWDRLSPGRRRGLAHGVATAKSEATIGRRVDAILSSLDDRDS